ncbi:amino acid ABC transporter permease [Frisingicoccus sp.]|uniref:amino acid ABC transporter permease n=1 Tax=Frisingicoccus sp. TaxID=1918627 RepID=UPI0025C67EBC|nr:amino acid ABC transporter permease [Frisingicoccus sp.]MDY4834174.1 amino acid ABC transporter permease [Frisingicoccus sp.]MDY4923398.1 amino acid ABC transporter permease [Frisingicoccus sp.]MDY5955913.1 amino acid ABC transporter permease [Frisingicoccus sp.]
MSIWESFDKAFLVNNRYIAYLEGFRTTLIISFFAVLLGVGVGLILAIIKYMANHLEKNIILTVLNWIANIYIAIIRGTPVYVQLLIIYFVIFAKSPLPPIVSAVICFGINSSAYVAEIIRAGIEAVDGGQMEAGRSLGLSWGQTMISIIMPQAIKNILPALGNEFIVLIKETAIVGTITVLDVTRAAQNVAVATFDYLPPLLITAAMYLVVVVILTKLLGTLERRLAQSDRR